MKPRSHVWERTAPDHARRQDLIRSPGYDVSAPENDSQGCAHSSLRLLPLEEAEVKAMGWSKAHPTNNVLGLNLGFELPEL